MITIENWLDNNELAINIWKNKYQHNDESFDAWLNRISNNDKDLKKLIIEKKFLFGGRILANRGTDENSCYSNCFVLPQPEDNLESIFETSKEMARTFSYGGGVGIDISKLRPKSSTVHNSAKTTTGAVSFMELYSMTTGLIGQRGRRK